MEFERQQVIPGKYMCLILKDEFCFFPVPFGSMVKFESFALFPVDNQSHPVMHRLTLILNEFAVFAYYCITPCEFLVEV